MPCGAVAHGTHIYFLFVFCSFRSARVEERDALIIARSLLVNGSLRSLQGLGRLRTHTEWPTIQIAKLLAVEFRIGWILAAIRLTEQCHLPVDAIYMIDSYLFTSTGMLLKSQHNPRLRHLLQGKLR